MKKMFIIMALVLSLVPLWSIIHKLGEFDTPGGAYAITVVGNIAYVAGDSGLQIIDVSNPQNPMLLGSYNTPDTANSIVVEDNLAYVVDCNSGLQIIDVSNLQNPVLLGSYDTPDLTQSVAVADSIAYLLRHYSWGDFPQTELRIIDVSNPQIPILLGSYNINTACWIYSITVTGSIAYLAAGNAGLRIIDISTPQNPILLCSYDTYPDIAYSVVVADSLAYVATGNSLLCLDVSNPQNPILMGSFNTPNWSNTDVCSIYLEDSIAYMAVGNNNIYGDTGYGRLLIIDFSNPQSPNLLGSYNTPDPGLAISIAVTNNIAYIADWSYGLQIIDVSSLQNPSLYGFYDTLGEAYCVETLGNIACVADGEAGLQIINASIPQNPALLSSYDTPGEAKSIAIIGNTVYVADGTSGLQIINLTNPLTPALLGVYTAQGISFDVKVVGSRAYLANTYSGLNIIDIFNPQNPSHLHSIGTSLMEYSFAVEDNLAFIADELGLRVYNVTNPNFHILLGSCETPGSAISVAVAGVTVYVADGESGLQVIDVSNPASPSIISTILPHVSSNINQCYLHDNLLFVSDVNWNEISIYNISNPQLPVLNNRYAWNFSTIDMCVAGDILFTANGSGGLNIHNLAIIDNDDEVQYPVTSFQMRNYPNPFNLNTNISYILPAKGQVCLAIYNSKGQLVKSLLNEPQSKGEHTLTWDGKDDNGHSVASGLYFCRIISAGMQESRKLLLLK